ncbi:hypothetical protein FNF29_00571 [Cafeteria roenbergensis]|uniref:Uncharacterized protein n=2 Tax=Cafeteria roenbergensis TaxID=33653 RepID=A0A5A8CX24_CAFRO|nr:hypothetical protein FNF29_00571 [Cafeteria roenbergensis]|eukprot:KAA0157219.1 hypothetical protein FNF29_00571 [Cafeteria roenbergensis]
MAQETLTATRAFITHLTGVTPEQLDGDVRGTSIPQSPEKAPEAASRTRTASLERSRSASAGSEDAAPAEAEQEGRGTRTLEEKRLIHARVLGKLKRGAEQVQRQQERSAKQTLAAADILSQLDPTARAPTHLVSAPAALAEASERLFLAMATRHDAEQRNAARAIARSRRRLKSDLATIEEERRAVMADPDRIEHEAAAFRAIVSSDFETMLDRNHMQIPLGTRSKGSPDDGAEPDEADRAADAMARQLASKAKRSSRPRPWRSSASSLDRVREQSGGRYVPPERRGEDSALAFTRAEQERLRAIERSGAGGAGDALRAAALVAEHTEKQRRRFDKRVSGLRPASKQRTSRGGFGPGSGVEGHDDDGDDSDGRMSQLSNEEGSPGDGSPARLQRHDSQAPLRDAEVLEASAAVARVMTALGVAPSAAGGTAGKSRDAALKFLEKWGVLPPRTGEDERRATFASPVHVSGQAARSALRAAGDPSSSRSSLSLATSGISMSSVVRARRYAEEPQTTDAAGKAIGKAVKGGGVPYKYAMREQELSGSVLAEGRKLGLTLPEVLLLSRCVKHRQQRQVLDSADEEMRRKHAESRAKESKQRMEEARAALSTAWRKASASKRSLGSGEADAPVAVGASDGGVLADEEAADDLAEAWVTCATAGSTTKGAKEPAATSRDARAEQGAAAALSSDGDEDEGKTAPGDGGAAMPAALSVPGSVEAKRLRRYEEAHGQTLGLSTRIEMLRAMISAAHMTSASEANDSAVSHRLLDPADVAGVGLDTEEEEEAAAARRLRRSMKKRWRARAKARRAMLRSAGMGSSGGHGDGESSGDEEDDEGDAGAGGGVASGRQRVGAGGWQPKETGHMTVQRARERLLSHQIHRRKEEDRAAGESRQLPRRFVEWPEGALGPRGEAIALPERRLDEALADGRKAMRGADDALKRLKEARESLPRSIARRLEAHHNAIRDGEDGAAGGSGHSDPPPFAARGTAAASMQSSGKTWLSDSLKQAGERATLDSLGSLPAVPRGREAWRLLAEQEIASSNAAAAQSRRGRDTVTMQRHEVQLELRALLEERHLAKVRLGEATKTGMGIERVFFSRLITNRSLNERA